MFYVLVDSKEERTYWNVLNLVTIQSNLKLEPENVTCDFEMALMNAVTD